MSETELILDAIRAVRTDVQGVEGRLGAVEISMKELAFRERERNGQIAKLSRWREGVEADQLRRHEAELQALGFDAGAEAVKESARRKVMLAWERVEKPVTYGTIVVLFGFGMRLAGLFIGGPW